MTDLPLGWAEATVGSIAASLVDGPFGSNLKTAHYQSSGVRVIRLQNIADGQFDDRDKAYISLAHANRLNRHEARPGDVLIAALGDVLPRVCLVPLGIDRAIVKADCFRLRPHEGISATYLAYTLSAPQMRQRASTEIAGVGRPRLNLRKVSALAIPVPPSAEQERIVAAIEEQFSRLDAGVMALEAVQQNLHRMRAASYRQMYNTALSASQLRPLKEVCEFIVDGDHNPPKRTSGGVPYLTAKHVKRGCISTDGVSYISQEDFALLRRRYDPRKGDVLVTCVGTLGEVAVVPPGLTFAADRNLAAIRPSARVTPSFLEAMLRSPTVQNVLTAGSGSTAQPHLYLRDLRQLEVPIPMLDTQESLIASLREQLGFADQLEADVKVALARGERLRVSILAAAFSGKLVWQDADEEPASILLKRTAEERASSKDWGPARTRKRQMPPEKAIV